MAVHSFSSPLQEWGRNYGLELPTDVSVALGIGSHVAVVGRINKESFHGTLTPMSGARHRLLLNADIRERAGLKLGRDAEVSLQRDPSNRVPPVPDDFAEALDILTSARDRFDAWPPSHQRETLLWIAEAVKPETRSRRIARAVSRLMEDV
jgi:hypothetical protein